MLHRSFQGEKIDEVKKKLKIWTPRMIIVVKTTKKCLIT